jgi:hypothetical protein
LENLSKINVERGFEAKRRYSFDNLSYFLLKSYLAQNLDENSRKYLNALLQTRKQLVESRLGSKVLTNYLTVMNLKYESFPESNLVDIYLPET